MAVVSGLGRFAVYGLRSAIFRLAGEERQMRLLSREKVLCCSSVPSSYWLEYVQEAREGASRRIRSKVSAAGTTDASLRDRDEMRPLYCQWIAAHAASTGQAGCVGCVSWWLGK